MVHVDRAHPGADTFEKEDAAELGLAAQDLQETKEQFRVLAESALTGIYLIQDDRFRYVNPGCDKDVWLHRRRISVAASTASWKKRNTSSADCARTAPRSPSWCMAAQSSLTARSA